MKYGFEIFKTKVEDHEFWVAESKSLKGCVGQGDTMDEAIREIEKNEIEWLETAKEYGIEIPSVPIENNREYSGKFMTRVSSFVHQSAAKNAKKEGISLNQYVNDAIVMKNTYSDVIKVAEEKITESLIKKINYTGKDTNSYKRKNGC